MSQIFADNLNLHFCFLRAKWRVAGKMERAGKKESKGAKKHNINTSLTSREIKVNQRLCGCDRLKS